MARLLIVLSLSIAVLLGALGNPAFAGSSRCSMCTKKIKVAKTVYVLELANGKDETCCCGHCGLLLHARMRKDVKSARTKDFLSGDELDAAKAYFVANSKQHPCCYPSMIAFKERSDAEKFSKVHGGVVAPFSDLLDAMSGKKKISGVKG